MSVGHKIRVTIDVASLIQHSHPRLKAKIRAALKEILENPSCGKALKDELEGLRSYGIKRIRIIYRIRKRYVEIVAIGPRRIIYEETFRLVKTGVKSIDNTF